jgi:acyl-coenzyme A thioesterase PaaI-like protein
VRAKVWFGPATEGPPGHVHGGALLTAFDHVLGAAAWFAGHPSFTARLEYDFRSMVPLGSVALVEGWVAEAGERKVRVEGRLLDSGGHLLGEGLAIMVKMRREHLESFERRSAEG